MELFHTKDGRLTEQMDYGLYGNEQWFKNLPDKDESGKPFISFNVNLDENSYSQVGLKTKFILN